MIIHNCLVSSYIEDILFDSKKYNSIDMKIDGNCPICLISLNKPGEYGCCGKYARKFKKCGHWVHVGCQINNNPNRHKCSICRDIIVDKKKLDYYVARKTMISTLPIHYQMMVGKNGVKIFDNMKYYNDLIKNYGFDKEFLDHLKKFHKNNN